MRAYFNRFALENIHIFPLLSYAPYPMAPGHAIPAVSQMATAAPNHPQQVVYWLNQSLIFF